MKDNTISCERLVNNEIVALGAIEVLSIPHYSILANSTESADNVCLTNQREFQNLLGEIYELFKTVHLNNQAQTDISIELIWTSHSVQNQPFNASIRMFLVIRAIHFNQNVATDIVSSCMRLMQATLSLQKYEAIEITYLDLAKEIKHIKDTSIKAIVKDERTESLQTSIFPYCYTYDRLSFSHDDLGRIVKTLSEYPDCSLSFQLIPTNFDASESATLDYTTQTLDQLSRGIMDRSVGNISFSLAEKPAETYHYYSNSKTSPLFLYNVLVMGDYSASSNLASRVMGLLSSGDKPAKMKVVDLYPEEVNKDNNFYPLPWAVNETLMECSRNENIWNSGYFSDAYYRLPFIITGEEGAEFFRLPIGSDRVAAGLNVNESGTRSKTYSPDIINAGDITVGKLRSSLKGDTIGLSINDLAKHMLIVGTPGSGKTTFSVSLLDRLWKEHHIPFLVIEPAKNEYRALVQSIPELQVFTPGKNHISPFVFNPFVPPKNVKLESYKSTLKTAFAAAVSMATPLDKIFEDTVNNCYSDFKWLNNYTTDSGGEIFNIADFIKCFQKTFDKIGYTGDARNIGRAGVVRLKSLATLFDNYYSIPIEDLLQRPTVIELAAIENSDQKALIIALLLLSVLAYVNANYMGTGGLRNFILIEEAHVLLDAASNAQGDANPSAIAQGLVKRMLAEIRSYGVGIAIADQSPRKVTTDIVALTDVKLAFRLVESEDKQIIADSTNMSDVQAQRLTKLRPGEAFLFFNKLTEPEEVITPDYRLENKISITLSDDGIKSLSSYWKDKSNLLRPYPQCNFCKTCASNCSETTRMLAKEIAKRIFNEYFAEGTDDFEVVRTVFGQITSLIKKELRNEPLTARLFSCTKLHLWRQIKYETNIPIRDIQIENSLKK